MPTKSKFNYKKAKKKTIKRSKRKVFKNRKKTKLKKMVGANGYQKHVKSLDKSQKDAEQAAQDAYDKALKEATQIVNNPKFADVFRKE